MTTEIAFTGSDIALIVTALGTLVSAIASSVAVVLGSLNRSTVKEVHSLVDGLTTAAVLGAGAQGNLTGRLEQTEERRVDDVRTDSIKASERIEEQKNRAVVKEIGSDVRDIRNVANKPD